MNAPLELPWPPSALTPNAKRRKPVAWTAERDELLRALHGTMPLREIAITLGTTKPSIRARITRLGIAKHLPTPDELRQEIVAAYQAAGESGYVDLSSVAQKWGKSYDSLQILASRMGLGNASRCKKAARKVQTRKYTTAEELRQAQSEMAKHRIIKNGHPRGMLGRSHTPEAKERMAVSTSAQWWSLTGAERQAQTDKALEAKLRKYGKLAVATGAGRSWKAGWREIGDQRIYFRSRWEANYARYLQWLKERGEILDWEYEPETFWFEKIKRGVRSYLPDFRVHELNGAKPLHEVKGWMDARSKTTLKRMAKYHPQETIVLIRDKEYRAISRHSAMIGGWE